MREEQEHLARQEEEADGLKMREREDWDMSRFGCSLNEIYANILYRSIPKIFLQTVHTSFLASGRLLKLVSV